MMQDEKSCPYYMRTGSCKFGVACKFNHPQPAPFGTALPLTGPSVFGSVGPAMLPSSGLPYAPGLPAWSFPKVQNSPDPHLQGPQSYMATLPPSQGILPAQGWNTYMVRVQSLNCYKMLAFLFLLCFFKFEFLPYAYAYSCQYAWLMILYFHVICYISRY